MEKCFLTRNNDQWASPNNIYNYYIHELGYYDFNPLSIKYEDSLKKEFNCNLFCNPPYSNIEPFVDYMIEHVKKGFKVIMLLPTRSGTKWFKKLIDFNHSKIYFFTQRLHFNESKSAPFDCFIAEIDLEIKNEIKFIDREMKEC